MTPEEQRARQVKILSWAAAGFWMAGLFIFSCIPGASAQRLLQQTASVISQILSAMGMTLDAQGLAELTALLPFLLQALGYMVLALLCWNALRTCGLGWRAAPALGLAVTTLFAVVDELHQIFTPGRVPRVTDWLVSFLSSLFILACLFLFLILWEKCPKLVNRETVSYVIFGVLTTIVNIVVYLLCDTAMSGVLNGALLTIATNSIAWVTAVIFAYVVNKLFVFHSKTDNLRAALIEFALFIGARLLSYGVDTLGMVLLVDVLTVNGAVSKVLMNIVVMIMNYFFSKWFIFKKNPQPGQAEPDPETHSTNNTETL